MTAANPYFGFRKDRSLTHALWEKFNCGLIDMESIRDPYQKALIEDWQRCAALGIDVAMRAGVRLSDEEHRRVLEDATQLLERARPAMAQVSACLVGVPGILILTNGSGTILQVEGDTHVKALAAERSGIVEGSCWLEQVAGTNGLGSAIRTRSPVHVFSAEHFCEGWHQWTCAATPIFDASGSDVVGVIDFTTIEKDYRDQALALTASIANSIRAGLQLDTEVERSFLLQRYAECASSYPDAGLVVLDRRGKVVRSTNDLCAQTYLEKSRIERTFRPKEAESFEVVLPTTGRWIGTIHLFQPHSRRNAVPVSCRSAPVMVQRGDFATTDPKTIEVLERVDRVAERDSVVLITGETGTGKELIARYLHSHSSRSRGPYVPVNCGAIAGELIASSFFGYVGGAFTGADPKGRRGYFEAASGGTLFLDEIGELPLEIQAALLRVLEDQSVQKIGADRPVTTDCRIVAATNRDLSAEVTCRSFRADLYYRLNVVQIALPALRQRPNDILMLARRFLERFGDGREHSFDSAAEAKLLRYTWPGNVRELRNVVEAATMESGLIIGANDLNFEVDAPAENKLALSGKQGVEDERSRILRALETYRKVGRAAHALGMSRATLYRKFASLGIDQSHYL